MVCLQNKCTKNKMPSELVRVSKTYIFIERKEQKENNFKNKSLTSSSG